MYDDGAPPVDRLRVVRDLMAREDALSFVPTVEAFLARHDPASCPAGPHTARDGWARARRPAPAFGGRGLFPCNLRLSSRYGVVNSRTSLFSPSLLPLLSIDVTV